MDQHDLDNRFAFHPARDSGVAERHEAVRDCLRIAAANLDDLCPDGREKSLAVTKLEEAMMWANAAIARHPADVIDVEKAAFDTGYGHGVAEGPCEARCTEAVPNEPAPAPDPAELGRRMADAATSAATAVLSTMPSSGIGTIGGEIAVAVARQAAERVW